MNCSNRNQQHCSNFASVLWLFVVGSAGGVVVVVDGVAVVVNVYVGVEADVCGDGAGGGTDDYGDHAGGDDGRNGDSGDC